MRGFTLPELLVVTGLVAAFLILGLPGLSTLRGNLATSVEQHRLLSLLSAARSAAIHGNRRTVLCPVDVEQPEPDCGPGPGAGWVLFADADGDRLYRPGEDELLRLERIPRSRALRVRDRRGEVFDSALTFRPDGSVVTPATVDLCAAGSRRTARIVVSMTGRVRTDREPVPCAA
ncbi:GspH/FimT family protein [Pseudohaliea sp.]|uniref:GspH/FimT family pseudopilin n=1 Tax=Pseudohaliea sp. TaxID=2740289 RepID=UPI0032EAAE8E